MQTLPDYDYPVFRPPSEANSLILQLTYGCSWNKCSFCEMYTGKQFSVKPEKDMLREIEDLAFLGDGVRKVFLADGNAMVLSTKRLLTILYTIRKTFPKTHRISAYALPSDIISKSESELKELYDAGLKLIYVGIESGDDEVLSIVNKNETYTSTVTGLLKSQNAGIHSSVMILNGLGGKKYSMQHAVNSAKVLNEIQPQYASTLVLSFPYGLEHFRKRLSIEYNPMDLKGLLCEMETFIEHIDLKETIFRSDHASNYLVLKGILSRDKNRFLSQIKAAIDNPENADIRPEWSRGL